MQAFIAAGLLASASTPHALAAEREPPAVEQPFRGLYVGVGSSITTIAGSPAAMIGPELGVVAGDYVFGVAGYGLGTAVETAPVEGVGRTAQVGLGYGVLQVGSILFREEPVHLTPLLLFGGGGVTLTRPAAGATGETIFVLEPKLELEVAPRSMRALRFGAHGSYRFVSAFELAGLDARALEGPAAGGFIKLGFF